MTAVLMLTATIVVAIGFGASGITAQGSDLSDVNELVPEGEDDERKGPSDQQRLPHLDQNNLLRPATQHSSERHDAGASSEQRQPRRRCVVCVSVEVERKHSLTECRAT
eukprot:2321101-Rhodomonas_salina.4